MSPQEIQQSTGIDAVELKRHLQSLACAKFKILKKHPPGRDVDQSDSFSFNADFTSSLQKIKISTVSSKIESTSERKETRERIDEERKYQIDVGDVHSCRVPGVFTMLTGLHRSSDESA